MHSRSMTLQSLVIVLTCTGWEQLSISEIVMDENGVPVPEAQVEAFPR